MRMMEPMGRKRNLNSRRLTIAPYRGGFNGPSVKLWKIDLQNLTDKSNLNIMVYHYPSTMRKWNRVENLIFLYIAKNQQGKPIRSYETMFDLMGNIRTKID